MRYFPTTGLTGPTFYNSSGIVYSSGTTPARIPNPSNTNYGFVQFSANVPLYFNILTNVNTGTIPYQQLFIAPSNTNNNLYVAASVSAASAISYPNNVTTYATTPARGSTGYSTYCVMIKYNAQGNPLWYVQVAAGSTLSGLTNVYIQGITTDTSDNAYMFGTNTPGQRAIVAFNANGTSGTLYNSASALLISFVAKYDSSGNFSKGCAFEYGSGDGSFYIKDCFIEPVTNHIYIAIHTSYIAAGSGGVRGPRLINNTLTLQSFQPTTARGIAFIYKLSAIGDNSLPLWVATINASTIDNGVIKVISDSSKNAYALYYVNGAAATLDLYHYNYTAASGTILASAVAYTFTNPTSAIQNYVLAKYNSTGTVQYGISFASTNASIFFQSLICSDPSNNIYVLIRANAAMILTDKSVPSASITYSLPSGSTDCQYLFKLSSTGIFVACAQIASSTVVHNMYYNSIRNCIYIDFQFTNIVNVYSVTTTTVGATTTSSSTSVLSVGATGNVGNMLLQFTTSLTPSLVGYCSI